MHSVSPGEIRENDGRNVGHCLPGVSTLSAVLHSSVCCQRLHGLRQWVRRGWYRGSFVPWYTIVVAMDWV